MLSITHRMLFSFRPIAILAILLALFVGTHTTAHGFGVNSSLSVNGSSSPPIHIVACGVSCPNANVQGTVMFDDSIVYGFAPVPTRGNIFQSYPVSSLDYNLHNGAGPVGPFAGVGTCTCTNPPPDQPARFTGGDSANVPFTSDFNEVNNWWSDNYHDVVWVWGSTNVTTDSTYQGGVSKGWGMGPWPCSANASVVGGCGWMIHGTGNSGVGNINSNTQYQLESSY
jgi:hypothetical protein